MIPCPNGATVSATWRELFGHVEASEACVQRLDPTGCFQAQGFLPARAQKNKLRELWPALLASKKTPGPRVHIWLFLGVPAPWSPQLAQQNSLLPRCSRSVLGYQQRVQSVLPRAESAARFAVTN